MSSRERERSHMNKKVETRVCSFVIVCPLVCRLVVLTKLDRSVSHMVSGVLCMSPPSLTWQSVCNVYVKPVIHMAGVVLHICHTQHSHGRWCVTHVSHLLLTTTNQRFKTPR